jgi:pimeloyl-ACP methyl ester carboxylesterase
MPTSVFYLGGDSFPADRGLEDALRALLTADQVMFVSHQDLRDFAAKAGLDWSFESRLAVLESAVAGMCTDRDIVLIGRSSGARIMALFASRRPVTTVVCVAYPFKNPKLVLEPERFAHLATLTTPTLIIQGIHDPYGGVDVTENYRLSPSIRLEFVNGTHEFVIDTPQCAHVPHLIRAFAREGWRDPVDQSALFDEAFYSALYPDVAKAIAAGSVPTGAGHFRLMGRKEGRRFRLLPSDRLNVREDPTQPHR